jgi:hypothetical protein
VKTLTAISVIPDNALQKNTAMPVTTSGKPFYSSLFSKFLLGIFVLMLFSVQSPGQIPGWGFAQKTGSEITLGATTLNAYLNSTVISRKQAVNPPGTSETNAANGYNTCRTLAGAIVSGDYFRFIVNSRPAFKNLQKPCMNQKHYRQF